MKKQKFTESQIVNAIKEHDAGKSALDICRELGVHKATFYAWRLAGISYCTIKWSSNENSFR